MFNSKKKKPVLENVKTRFVIPQIEDSLAGLKTSRGSFKKSEFASSLYGSGIKDVSTYHDNASEGIDVKKAYDNYRSKENKKISEDELMKKYGTKFPEFQQINLDTAKEVYGEKITVNKVKHQETKETPVSFSFIKDKEACETKNEILEQAQSTPVINDETKNDSGFSFNFDDNIVNENVTEDANIDEIEALHPTIEITDDEDEFFESTKPQTFTNIVKRTKEEKEAAKMQGTPFIEREPKEPEPILEKEEIQVEPQKVEMVPEAKKETVSQKIPDSVNPYKNYIFPPIDKFKRTPEALEELPEWVTEKKEIINETLESFDISGEVVNFTKGPTFTRYEILLQNGINVKKVANLQDTFQANLGVTAIRIQAPIPGKRTIGIEVPNDKRETVWFGDIITKDFVNDGKPLNVSLGKDIDGNIITSDISSWPHGLVAGSTGSGKSVCINTILVSLLLKNRPDELKLILVDPKQVELITYNDLPHLITPVISDPKTASEALKWSCDEMDRRYGAFASVRARGIKDYNEKCKQDVSMKKLPYIVIIIDELADLMQVCSSDVEDSIQRLTQKARAAGIHLICATQRPTTDVIKGTIKNNIPTRVAFRVTAQVDSFTILDEGGAEALLGKGDMLLKNVGIERLQGSFIPDEEIDYVTDFIKAEAQPDYLMDHDALKAKFENDSFGSPQNNGESAELLYQVARFFIESETCSVNLLQQQFNLGFNRASRIVSALEEMGVVSGKAGTKGREVLMTLDQINELFEREE